MVYFVIITNNQHFKRIKVNVDRDEFVRLLSDPNSEYGKVWSNNDIDTIIFKEEERILINL